MERNEEKKTVLLGFGDSQVCNGEQRTINKDTWYLFLMKFKVESVLCAVQAGAQ